MRRFPRERALEDPRLRSVSDDSILDFLAAAGRRLAAADSGDAAAASRGQTPTRSRGDLA